LRIFNKNGLTVDIDDPSVFCGDLLRFLRDILVGVKVTKREREEPVNMTNSDDDDVCFDESDFHGCAGDIEGLGSGELVSGLELCLEFGSGLELGSGSGLGLGVVGEIEPGSQIELELRLVVEVTIGVKIRFKIRVKFRVDFRVNPNPISHIDPDINLNLNLNPNPNPNPNRPLKP
jgi:hypothetical protein